MMLLELDLGEPSDAFDRDDQGHCSSCDATIDLGRLEWVLARVESGADWSARELAPDQLTLERLDAIQSIDADFNPEVFTDRVMALYPDMVKAIRDPGCSLARVAISPPLRRQLEALQASRDQLGWPAVVDSINVTGVAISNTSHDSDGDAVTVDISGTSVVYEIDAAGRVVSGHRSAAPIVDCWTLVRPAGAITRSHGGVIAELCPNCGAPIELNDAGMCAHCSADITRRTRDWTLSAIDVYVPVQAATDEHVD